MTDKSEEKVYITKSNAGTIMEGIRKEKAKILGLKYSELPGESADKISNEKDYMLSEGEMNWLLCAKVMYNDFEVYIDEIYIKRPKTCKHYISEVTPPSYHRIRYCSSLHSDLNDPYLIPEEVKKLKEDEQIEFCEWFMKNKDEFEQNPALYIDWASKEFGIQFDSLPKKEHLSKRNSGKTEITDDSPEKLENDINIIRNDALKFYEKNSNSRKIIEQYGDESHIIEKYFPDKSCDEYKILKEWDNKKRKMKDKIRDYFKIKFNKELEFKKNLLEQLGFKPCKLCYK